MNMSRAKLAMLKGAIVLVPSYAMAFMTGQMVWTIPTMTAAALIATTLSSTDAVASESSQRVEDQGGEGGFLEGGGAG